MLENSSTTRCHTFAVALYAGFAAASAFGQSANWPSADVIARADRYDPPKATELAAKLSQQPDMTGLWTQLAPKGVGAGPVFDPEHTYYSPLQPVAGEARFANREALGLLWRS